MPLSTLPRRHRPGDRDRRRLERAGWRTLLEYTENHVRARDGTLVDVQSRWTAIAEFGSDASIVASATSANLAQAWLSLRLAANEAHRVAATRDAPRARVG
jgi:hypothetical protein